MTNYLIIGRGQKGSLYLSLVAHSTAPHPSFLSMKQLGVLLPSP